MKAAALCLLLAGPAAAAPEKTLSAPAVVSTETAAMISTGSAVQDILALKPNLTELHERFIETVEGDKQRVVLEAIALTTPSSLRDVQSLFDLFMRFSQTVVRNAVMASVGRLDESNIYLETTFIEYLKLPESEAQIFGINGALRLRSRRALPLITEIAKRRFSFKSPGETPILSDRNAWWAQYEALSALAQWQGAEVLPLLRRKAGEAPAVAGLMARYFWKESLPQIAAWAGAGASGAEKAHEALTSDVPPAALRATRPDMLRIVLNPKSDRELRHLLAVKLGQDSHHGEIDELMAQERSVTDPVTKLMLSTALFASNSPRTIPWLKSVAVDAADPKTRIGALLQLRWLLKPDESRALVEAAAAHDPDPDNRQTAADMLKTPASAP